MSVTGRLARCIAVIGTVFLAQAPAAFAQGLNSLNDDGFAPMSLMPEAAPIPRAGSFSLVPVPASEPPADTTGAPIDPPKKPIEEAAIDPAPAAAPVEQVVARVPMPPRRPFNLGFRKNQKPLLAKLEAAPVQVRNSSMTRSLMPLDDLPGVRLRSGGLVQQASLTRGDVRSDADQPSPDAQSFIGQGRIGGGLIKQTPSVQTGCLRPDLLNMLRKASAKFGRPVVITSGFRGGGRRGSYHRKCMAADVKIDGVSKQTLAAYFRSLPDAGGVGTYCHNGVVHVDTAEPRNWTYCGFRRTSFSLRGGGWAGNTHVRAGQPLPDDADE
jgi:hypothetical protein